MADLRFGAWAQSAIGRASEHPDDGRATLRSAELRPRAMLRGPGIERPVSRSQPLEMLGPGGVQGLDPRLVGRVFPAAGTADASTNDLAAVELTRPELPWLLTPARAGPSRHLRPWLVLVVVEAGRAFDPAARPLPVLRVGSTELPDLAESWAWAHVQYPPAGEHGIARLLCPRGLGANRRYRACLVPAFEGGRAAGMGATGAATRSHARAWEVEPEREVALPVYHWWEFGTGPEGDFEDYVRRLKPAEPVAGLGAQEVDVASPWPGADPLAGAGASLRMPVGGAMRPIPAPTDAPPPDPVPRETIRDFRARLARQLNTPAARLDGAHDPDDATGAVAPPLYGGRHVGVDRVVDLPGPTLVAPGWVADLNLAPANRVAAGLGAEYVRTNQEELMARAWEQVGAIREANRRRALAELATDVSGSVHRRHVRTLSPGELMAMAAPAAPRTRTAGSTLAMNVRVSPLADAAASSSFARFMRRSGPVARRTRTSLDSVVTRGLRGAATVPDPQPVLSATADPAAETDVAPLTASGAAQRLVILDAVRRVADANGLEAAAGTLSGRLGAIAGLDALAVGSGDAQALVPALEEQMDTVREAMRGIAVADFAAEASEDGRFISPVGVQIDALGLARRLQVALEPGDRIAVRLASRIGLPDDLDGAGLRPLMSHPTFPLPMALALLRSAPEWFLPGLGAFPADRTALLEPNDAFIESYLVGLSHELMSELLWREYPTDRRGTPFQRFWPRPPGAVDIPRIDTWAPRSVLGIHAELGGDELAILLVRGEVVRRFPDMIVTAVRAAASVPGRKPAPSTDPGDVRTPLFVLPIDPSTAAYAFRVPPGELSAPMTAAAPGWFFVFGEHDYRMRFGFDLQNDELRSWDDLDWDRVADARGFARIGGGLDAPVGDPPEGNPLGLQWRPDADATHIARIALQKPFRVAMHANLLLAPVGG